jgi:hypothetical protein
MPRYCWNWLHQCFKPVKKRASGAEAQILCGFPGTTDQAAEKVRMES